MVFSGVDYVARPLKAYSGQSSEYLEPFLVPARIVFRRRIQWLEGLGF